MFKKIFEHRFTFSTAEELMATQADRYTVLRTSLIDAAERIIAESGLAALRTRDLAREVGCSVGTIYNVFEASR